MDNRKTSIVVCTLVLFAFIFGYKRETISSVFDSFFSRPDSPIAAPTNDTKPSTETRVDSTTEHYPTPPNPAGTNPYMEFLKNQGAPTKQPTAGAPAPTPAANTLGRSLNSISQDKIQDHQKKKRNLYFEKLSEQMKALRGETTSSPVANQLSKPTTTAPPTETEDTDQREEAAENEIEAAAADYDDPIEEEVDQHEELEDQARQAAEELEHATQRLKEEEEALLEVLDLAADEAP